MTQRFRGNDLLAICCICWGFIESTIDVKSIILEAPLIYDDVCCEESCLDVFCIPARERSQCKPVKRKKGSEQ